MNAEKLKSHIATKNLEAKEIDGKKTMYALFEDVQALLDEQKSLGWKPSTMNDLFKITTPDGVVVGLHFYKT